MSVAYHRVRSDRLHATVFPEAEFLREEPVPKRAVRAAPARMSGPSRVGRAAERHGAVLRLPERAWLFMLGGTSALPLMNFTVTGFSVICVAIGLAYLLPGPRRRTATPLVFAVIGTAAYFASAWVNETSYLSPNVFAFGSFALYFCGITVLAGDIERIATVLLGIASGSVFFYVVIGTFLTSAGGVVDLWKYGVAPSATIAVLYALAACRVRTPQVVTALLALGALSLVLNFRSHAVVCCAAALLLVLSKYRRGTLSLITRVVTLGVFAVGFTWTLEFAAREGLLGGALRDKVLMQSDGSVPMLLAGRTEPPLSLTAIVQRPLLGWGNANNISRDAYVDAQHAAMSLGFDRSFPYEYAWKLSDGSISLHSVLLGSWAEAGVLAALLPLWLLWACYRLIFVADSAGVWTPLMMYLGIQTIWDLLFSPWSYNLPAVFACLACCCVAVHSNGRHNDSTKDAHLLMRLLRDNRTSHSRSRTEEKR
ncbi:hypothetical protein [Rhodococcus sp. BS-15]|uniref:hypothetical protein n=1 Tax=Rhodococcus sp. BS-15 TaxID=1304954 RepID=UPI001F202582|nr:hypothetical protein [Rhodococcus sp. BS-15]